MIHVVCLKWGDKYSVEYVNRLYSMVARHLQQPFRFYCMTENTTGICAEVNTLPLPDLGLQGWWYKLYLFNKDFFGLTGRVLFLDLDVVITGSIDSLLAYSPDQFCIAPDEKPVNYNSSVMSFELGSMPYVWESFWHQKEKIMQIMHGDQDWIQHICLNARIFPKPFVVSFKYDCNSRAKFGGGMLGCWLRKKGLLIPTKYAVLPEGALIVLFHGKPDPEDVMNKHYDKYRYAPWVKEYWR